MPQDGTNSRAPRFVYPACLLSSSCSPLQFPSDTLPPRHSPANSSFRNPASITSGSPDFKKSYNQS